MSEFTTRKDGDVPHITGYFAVFNKVYEVFKGCTESIAPGAFIPGTLELREDEIGLWGDVAINPKDSEAMNCLARVERGDVSQCSIGFDIIDEGHEILENGTHHYTIRKVKLYEVSCCTFPAYEDTAISARKADIAAIEKRRTDVWREERHKRLKEVSHGA